MIGKFAIRGNGKKTPKLPKTFFAGLWGSRPGPRLGLRPRPQLGLAHQIPHPVTIIHAWSPGAVAAPAGPSRVGGGFPSKMGGGLKSVS